VLGFVVIAIGTQSINVLGGLGLYRGLRDLLCVELVLGGLVCDDITMLRRSQGNMINLAANLLEFLSPIYVYSFYSLI